MSRSRHLLPGEQPLSAAFSPEAAGMTWSELKDNDNLFLAGMRLRLESMGNEPGLQRAAMSPVRLTILACALLLAAPALANSGISIGSKKFTESYVLAGIAKIQLENSGFEVSHREGMGGTLILWQALLSGEITLYPEYTATISEEILKTPGLGSDELRVALARLGIGITGDLGFDNSYALVMRRRRAAELGVRSISGLSRYPNLKAGLTPEFLGRRDGWKPLISTYGLHFDSVSAIEHGLGYKALRSGLIDIKDCYTTDAEIAEFDLLALADDRHFFPQYHAVFLYRLDMPPGALNALRSLEGKIDVNRMISLNRIAETAKSYALASAAFFGDRPQKPLPSEEKSGFAAIPRLTLQHLSLVAVSLTAAIVIGIPLGIAAGRDGIASGLILGGTGVIQTIPSLALLALMIPLFGIGQPPAIAALFLYSLLPIVSGTATGLRTIPASLKQAGAALGLTSRQRLWLIDLPVSAPSILSGIKTSAVINVGTATLAGLVGGGGYGEPIQSGLELNDTPLILTGAVPAAILAILVQMAFAGVEFLAVPEGLRLQAAARPRA
jgi:osmoprotectant transport system permease protein